MRRWCGLSTVFCSKWARSSTFRNNLKALTLTAWEQYTSKNQDAPTQGIDDNIVDYQLFESKQGQDVKAGGGYMNLGPRFDSKVENISLCPGIQNPSDVLLRP